jgi:hypothetical protein
MTILSEIVVWICQILFFCIGFGTAGLTAHLGGDLIAWAFDINELIPTAVIFFAAVALIGWTVDRIWPESWMYNPFL